MGTNWGVKLELEQGVLDELAVRVEVVATDVVFAVQTLGLE